MTEKHFWKVHTPNLIAEVLKNPGASVLTQPMGIFGNLLAAVAERAIELDDPQINILMLRLTLYDQGDPTKHSHKHIEAQFAEQRRRLQAKAQSITDPLPACPFCGGQSYTTQSGPPQGKVVRCSDCSARTVSDHGQPAIEEWCRRTPAAPLASVDNPAATSESS